MYGILLTGSGFVWLDGPMIQSINQPVAVGLVAEERQTRPRTIQWQGRVYKVERVCFYHFVRRGREKIHVFSVNVGALDMRIEINGEDFAARLTEVSDGLAD